MFAKFIPQEVSKKGFFVYLYILYVDYVFQILYQIIGIIGQFVAPNERAIKKLNEVMTNNMLQLQILFCNRVYERSRLFFVSVAQNSQDLTSLVLIHVPHMLYYRIKQNYFFQRNVNICIFQSMYMEVKNQSQLL